MRLDRSISLGVMRPMQKAWGYLSGLLPALIHHSTSLPILMYHSVSDTEETGVSEYYKVCTSPVRFAEQMAFLASQGWMGMPLSRALAGLNEGPVNASGPKAKLFAITFDDGFRDFHSAAFSVLNQHGFSATMYLATGFISNQRRSFQGRECLTWSEVRELHDCGVEFGSHTVNHPKLVELPWSKVEAELQASKRVIEQELNTTVTAFGYPFAFPQAHASFVCDFKKLVATAGYTSCVTTAIGRASPSSDQLCLPRLPANSADDPVLLEGKLQGAYDWVSLPQRLRKLSKGRSNGSSDQLSRAQFTASE